MCTFICQEKKIDKFRQIPNKGAEAAGKGAYLPVEIFLMRILIRIKKIQPLAPCRRSLGVPWAQAQTTTVVWACPPAREKAVKRATLAGSSAGALVALRRGRNSPRRAGPGQHPGGGHRSDGQGPPSSRLSDAYPARVGPQA